MAQTPSNMIPLGSSAPVFTLPDVVTGKLYNLKDAPNSKAYLIMFICNHCPYVKYVLDGIVKLGIDYADKQINIIAISSNDAVKYPEDGPKHMKALALDHNFTFPYLYDESQEVAKSYKAACTPDFYIFDHALQLVYRGQMDGARPKNNIPITGEDIRKALDNILAGRLVDEHQVPSIGCNIKWKD